MLFAMDLTSYYPSCSRPTEHADLNCIHLEAIREEEAWLDKHGLRGETLEMREKRLRLYKKAPFTARSHVNYWRQRFKCLWHRQLYQ